MATARDVVYRALRLIQAVDAADPVDANDADAGLIALNRILHRYPGAAHTDYTLSSTVTISDARLGDLDFMLAYELAPEFGRDVPPIVAREWPGARSRFAATYQYVNRDTSLLMAVDTGLQNMPSQFEPGNYRQLK